MLGVQPIFPQLPSNFDHTGKGFIPAVSQSFVLLELFAGLLPASVVLSELGLSPEATYYAETNPDALEVAYKQFPQAVALGDVRDVSQSALHSLVSQHRHSKWIVLGGPPCTDVSLLKSQRTGAFGESSVLREEFGRIFNHLHVLTSGNVWALME